MEKIFKLILGVIAGMIAIVAAVFIALYSLAAIGWVPTLIDTPKSFEHYHTVTDYALFGFLALSVLSCAIAVSWMIADMSGLMKWAMNLNFKINTPKINWAQYKPNFIQRLTKALFTKKGVAQ